MLVGGKAYPMSDEPMMRDLFDRWERVWHEGQFDLVPSCVGEHYTRHDEGGDRTVSREAYAAEIAKIRQERPDIRVVWYTIIRLKVIVRGFGLRSNGPIRKPTSPVAEPGCSPIGSRTASLLRHGFQCSR
jgi:hypothetical protein